MVTNVSSESKNLHRNPLLEGVRWSEKYSVQLSVVWNILPKYLKNLFICVAILLFATVLKGDWIVIGVHLWKQFWERESQLASDGNPVHSILTDYGLDGLSYFIVSAVLGSYLIYFAIGGFIHWYFYINRRDKAHEWKCQPEKFLSPELELHEILVGASSLLIVSILSGFVACYALNGGKGLTIYYGWNEYGWLWFALQFVAIFVYQDYTTYWVHRIFHWPWLYRNFHKLHHTYKQPTAFSVTASHPVEIIFTQLVMLVPIVTVPIHWAPFYVVVVYAYCHGILGHSGVNFKSFWWQPWQPDTIFHDNHHQYFHVNFGFNIYYWDILHGTYRQKDRVYSESIFYGQGKGLDEVSEKVLLSDMIERNLENPQAYRNSFHRYKLDEHDMAKFVVNNKVKTN
ncbi:lathosterol oxidase [Culex quinquefasciatus]|uniref:lathosterol oxidase n=1 Tax=Culex quinquefasciatus TaxID=7176 RepID=UPI0018E2C60C|nr:lathosterol oxidase [Culex quinquefasciatus]